MSLITQPRTPEDKSIEIENIFPEVIRYDSGNGHMNSYTQTRANSVTFVARSLVSRREREREKIIAEGSPSFLLTLTHG